MMGNQTINSRLRGKSYPSRLFRFEGNVWIWGIFFFSLLMVFGQVQVMITNN